MADGMKLKVVTPTGGFYDGDVSMVELTTTEGEIGVYPNHIPLTAVVAPGVLKIHENGGEKEAALMSGFITILPEQVTVIGGKTGTTSAAGNCLILLSKDTSGNPYISVILHSSDRAVLYTEMTELLNVIN